MVRNVQFMHSYEVTTHYNDLIIDNRKTAAFVYNKEKHDISFIIIDIIIIYLDKKKKKL